MERGIASLDELELRLYTSAPLESLASEIEESYRFSAPLSDVRARSAVLLGLLLNNAGDSRANIYFDEAYALASKLNLDAVRSDVLSVRAIEAFRSGNRKSFYALANQALLLAMSIGHYFRAAYSNLVLGTIALRLGSSESGLQYLTDALAIAQIHGFLRLKVRILSDLSELRLASGDFAQAKTLALSGIDQARSLCAGTDLLTAMIRLATIELELKNYPQVLELVAEVRATLPKANKSLWCVTHTLVGNVHATKHRWEKAEVEFKTAIKLADYPNSERVRSNVHTHLSELYLKRKRYKEALKESLLALKDAETAQDVYVRKDALRLVHQCYKALGKFKEAHRYLESYNELVAESDTQLLKNRLEYHELRNEFERERLESAEKTKAADLLRLELNQKEQELTEKTRHLIKQTEALTQFRDDLRAMIRRSPADDPLVKQIRERLQSLPESQLNWEDFDEQFKAVHPKFLHELTKKYPELTAMERKVCVLLRLNLTSVDIAKLLYLSERNIENHRYRIRKKLCLESAKSLHEFLAKF